MQNGRVNHDRNLVVKYYNLWSENYIVKLKTAGDFSVNFYLKSWYICVFINIVLSNKNWILWIYWISYKSLGIIIVIKVIPYYIPLYRKLCISLDPQKSIPSWSEICFVIKVIVDCFHCTGNYSGPLLIWFMEKPTFLVKYFFLALL